MELLPCEFAMAMTRHDVITEELILQTKGLFPEAIKSLKVDGKIVATNISINPKRYPASAAPLIYPRPPRMAATNAFHPMITPI